MEPRAEEGAIATFVLVLGFRSRTKTSTRTDCSLSSRPAARKSPSLRWTTGAVKELKFNRKIGSFRQEACAGALAPPRWNARSARVFSQPQGAGGEGHTC